MRQFGANRVHPDPSSPYIPQTGETEKVRKETTVMCIAIYSQMIGDMSQIRSRNAPMLYRMGPSLAPQLPSITPNRGSKMPHSIFSQQLGGNREDVRTYWLAEQSCHDHSHILLKIPKSATGV